MDISEWYEFGSRFLCVVGKKRCTENTGMGYFLRIIITSKVI